MIQEVKEQVDTNSKEVGNLVKKNKIKYILAVIIFLLGFIFYVGFMIIWQDNHTTYTLFDCTESQKEIIRKEINVYFPDSVEIDEIIYYWTWGNDISRTYNMILHMNIDDYEEFVIEDTNHISINVIEQNDIICTMQMIYISDTYTSLAGWMEDNGQENIGYKRGVGIAIFFLLIIISLIPLIPYKKIAYLERKL